ncbi:winged helix-turn-helix transcriptional regulator [Methanospirillum lacunae]|uniref:winged helix-turn-helix transcriptional regulator n=1 Tax=Methanospirillum lacunae TaxID=668570 RepID=UPI001FEC543C|nr:helix-turn-helix domain-containing protein [Methanospirillum lacunae]
MRFKNIVVTFIEATIGQGSSIRNHTESNNNECITRIEKILSIIGSKWTIQILRELSSGTKRFAQLQKSLKGISPKTLSTRLQELESYNIITKTVYPEVPPRVEYSFSSQGEGLKKVLFDLYEWGEEFLGDE